MWAKNRHNGFTIVELLVVVVVIAILAAITIVAYSGVKNRAVDASLKSDAETAGKLLTNDNTINGSYPATGAAANNNKGLPASNGNSYSYTPDNTGSPKSFSIIYSNPASTNYYRVTSSNLAPTLVAGSFPLITNTYKYPSGSFPSGLIGPYNQPVYVFYGTSGSTMTMSISYTAVPAATIQWQRKPLNGSFSNISGATSASYTTPILNSSNDNDMYRAIVTNSVGYDQTQDTGLWMDYSP